MYRVALPLLCTLLACLSWAARDLLSAASRPRLCLRPEPELRLTNSSIFQTVAFVSGMLCLYSVSNYFSATISIVKVVDHIRGNLIALLGVQTQGTDPLDQVVLH